LIRPEEQEQPIASEQLGFEIKTNSNFPSPASDYREVSNDRR
jgi:hypothetical protein